MYKARVSTRGLQGPHAYACVSRPRGRGGGTHQLEEGCPLVLWRHNPHVLAHARVGNEPLAHGAHGHADVPRPEQCVRHALDGGWPRGCVQEHLA